MALLVKRRMALDMNQQRLEACKRRCRLGKPDPVDWSSQVERVSSNYSLESATTSGIEGNTNSARTKGVQDHEAGLWTKLIFCRAKRRYGHVTLSTRIRAHIPKLPRLAERMSLYTIAPGTASPKLKELVQLKVAAMVGCPF